MNHKLEESSVYRKVSKILDNTYADKLREAVVFSNTKVWHKRSDEVIVDLLDELGLITVKKLFEEVIRNDA